MPKINQYYIKPEIKKPVEIVQEVNENNWWQKQSSIKKSSLSPSARNKIISKSGSDFRSEKEGYGPCEYYNCPHPSSRRFYLKMYLGGSELKFNGSEGEFSCMTMRNIEGARSFLRQLEYGECKILEKRRIFPPLDYILEDTNYAWRMQNKAEEILRYWIRKHEEWGEEVYQSGIDIEKGEGCVIS